MGWRDIEAQLANQIPPEVQRKRDAEALRLKKGERATATGETAAALDREISRDTKALGWRAIEQELASAPLPETAAQTTPGPGLNPAPTPGVFSAPKKPSRRGGTVRELREATPGEVTPGDGALDPIALAQGIGSGVTLGTTKYGDAAVRLGLNKAIDDGKLTWSEALQRAKEGIDETRKRSPGSYLLGTAAGGLMTSVGTGGAGLGTTLARGAVQGGVSGFTENEDLGEAARGALFGTAALGGGKALEYGAKSAAKMVLAGRVARQKAELEGAFDVVKGWGGKNGDWRKALDPASGAPQEVVDAAKVIHQFEFGRRSTPGATDLPYRSTAEDAIHSDDYNRIMAAARGHLWPEAKRGMYELARETSRLAQEAGVGAALGAGGASLLGHDPWTGAVLGAGYGGLNRLNSMAHTAARRFGGAAATLLPRGTGETLGLLTTNVVTSPKSLKEANDYLHRVFSEE